MITEYMYSAGFEFLDDGNVNIEQDTGSPEGSTYVTLHPVQVRVLAERMGLLEPSLQVPEPLVTESHKRRLQALCGRIAEFYHCEHFLNEILERCGDGPEMWLHIRAIHEMAEELVSDIGGDTPSTDATRSVDATPIANTASPQQPELAL